jgi:hypothetical protein
LIWVIQVRNGRGSMGSVKDAHAITKGRHISHAKLFYAKTGSLFARFGA